MSTEVTMHEAVIISLMCDLTNKVSVIFSSFTLLTCNSLLQKILKFVYLIPEQHKEKNGRVVSAETYLTPG